MLENKIISLVATLSLLLPGFVLAAMSSTNYYIYADSVDFGGGMGTSTSYTLQDSLGGYSVGISTSTSYQVRAGYQAAEMGQLSFSLDSNSVNLGTLSAAGVVATSDIIATITTDSATGYTLSVSGVTGSSLAAVSDGAVDSVGSGEEYGLAVSGVHAAYADDVAVANNLVLSSASSPVSSATSTLTFKAVRASGSTANTYTQTLTLVVAANI